MRAMRAIAFLQLAIFFSTKFLYYIIYNIKIIILLFYHTIQIPFGAHGAHGAPLL